MIDVVQDDSNLDPPSSFEVTIGPETLYHYCDAVAFESITRTNELWLCPFPFSNDSLEGKAGRQVLATLAEASGVPARQLTHFLGFLEEAANHLLCFGMSMSVHGDLLSQWRGYAADGAGFAIGFDRGRLNQLPSHKEGNAPKPVGNGPALHKVEYREPHTTERIRQIYEAIEPHVNVGFSHAGDVGDAAAIAERALAKTNILTTLLQQWGQLFSVKSPAFEEEGEWRLASNLLVRSVGVDWRVSRGMLSPYIRYRLPAGLNKQTHPLRRVVLGPKNPAPERLIADMLCTRGFGEVEVTRSAASYR